MERLKTPKEKEAEFAQFAIQKAKQEEARKLEEIEPFKPYIIKLINECTSLPLILLFTSHDGAELGRYLFMHGESSFNLWLRPEGYAIVGYPDSTMLSGRRWEIAMLWRDD